MSLKMAKLRPCVLIKVKGPHLPRWSFHLRQRRRDTYILEYDSKILSLYSKKAEGTGSVFKTVHHFLAFWMLTQPKGLPIRLGRCEAQHQLTPKQPPHTWLVHSPSTDQNAAVAASRSAPAYATNSYTLTPTVHKILKLIIINWNWGPLCGTSVKERLWPCIFTTW